MMVMWERAKVARSLEPPYKTNVEQLGRGSTAGYSSRARTERPVAKAQSKR